MEQLETRTLHYDGLHCALELLQPSVGVIVLRISGSDVGEFGEAPMLAISEWLRDGVPVDFFIDARDVRGASVEVSGDWAVWMGRHRARLQSVTMLTGSRFIQVTAEFVRRFSSLEGIMRICTEAEVFDAALADALRSA